MRKILRLAVGIFGLSIKPFVPRGFPQPVYRWATGTFAKDSATFTGYANRWLGITGDFGAYYASPFGVSANAYRFLVGPLFSYASFAQVLLGGAHLTADASGISASTSGFAWSAGGGIDPGLSRPPERLS